MNTTTLFAEILIIGIQALIWITMIVLSIFGFDWINEIKPDLKDWSSIVAILLMAVGYTIGIIIDRIAYVFFQIVKPQNLLMKCNKVENWSKNAHNKQILAVYTGVSLIQYIRSKIRIIRSTTINLIFILLASALFVNQLTEKIGISKTILAFSLLLILIFTCVFTQAILEISYKARIDQLSDEKKD